ncbi:MAG TPA: RagB/SusD family nutrient uptake outer membrane protein [Puia sp.]
MNRYISLCFICLVLLTGSCKKSFLELAPLSNSNAANFYKTQADFDLAVNNAYATLYTVYGPLGMVSFTGELMSDNATLYQVAGSGSINTGDKWAFRDYSIIPTNNLVNQFWSDAYTSLYSVNIVIDKLKNADLADSYKTQITAEMSFLRALYYFDMVQIWGDVPLITTPVSSDASFKMNRTPAQSVYGQIITDLKFAADNLPDPDKVPAPGRASKAPPKPSSARSTSLPATRLPPPQF